jgi:hypothetical protein
VLKMCQSCLVMLGVPAVVCVADVCGDYVSCDVAHGAKEFSWAPEVSFAEMVSQPGMLPEKAEGASAFEQLQSARNAHIGRQAHEQMHVVGLNLQLEYLHPIFLRDFAQKTLAVVADHCEFERVLCIFGLPHQVESVLSYSMAMGCQLPSGMPFGHFHFFMRRRADFCTAHANSTVRNGCAKYAARTHLLRNSAENKKTDSNKERDRVRNSSAA